MAWNWMVTKIDYEAGSTAVNMEVRIWKDAWTAADKSIVRYWSFPNVDTLTTAQLATMAQNEVTAYLAMKAKKVELETILNVAQVLP